MSCPSLPSATLESFYEDGWITGQAWVVKSGKEATVYCCEATMASGHELLAVKIYRPRESRSFKNDAIYHEGRYIPDKRLRRAFQKKTTTGRKMQFGGWISHEFQTLMLLHQAGSDVPLPLAATGEAILMSYLGDREAPAPPLQSVALERHEARPLFERILRNVELWLALGCIHADLSAFNMLYWQGEVTIIDFPQAVDPNTNPNAYDLLARDVANVCRYFNRQGLQADPSRIAHSLWQRYLSGTLCRQL